jgi:prepilin-type N-terminal cleavage/methylation domain-containing protein
MRTNLKKFIIGFTLIELVMVLAIITVMFGVVVAMKTPFQNRMSLRNSALALQQDLRVAQAYVLSDTDLNTFYGIRFYKDIGEDILGAGNKRQGWKIIRYQGANPVVDFDIIAPTTNSALKSCVVADNPQIFDRTFFERGVTLDATSELQVNPGAGQWHSIIFNKMGQATSNGQTLLNNGQNIDDIVLTGFGNTISIHITPETGHVYVP